MKYSSSSHTVKEQYVEQVWFPGMHGDVGGGQEKPSHLSTHPLAWMLFKAQTHGLVLNRYGHSMLTPCYDCPFFYQDSYTSMIAFRLLPRIDRVIDCDEKSNKYLESQIYLCGDFSSFIKSEDLAKYHSKALLVFKSHFDVNSENDVI
jgi:hypothetical protein